LNFDDGISLPLNIANL